jgi:hypothetical protein
MLVTADGVGVVSHAGTELLRELAVSTGLVGAWTEAFLDTYRAAPTRHLPGRVLADLAVVVADGARSISDLAGLRDRPGLFAPVASTATAWRGLDRVDDSGRRSAAGNMWFLPAQGGTSVGEISPS